MPLMLLVIFRLISLKYIPVIRSTDSEGEIVQKHEKEHEKKCEKEHEKEHYSSSFIAKPNGSIHNGFYENSERGLKCNCISNKHDEKKTCQWIMRVMDHVSKP
ncbi:hypothetical protein RhiirA1_471867 [Rhizophagus irregularis]|uniref:SWIM-type domain-containing protein n=1 Tax=Rhizophagus irregularis TaxID=588596 RepID=A0A2N0R3G8_9GLOM|nr:hypothetical protein RhiirA1_471867 [Rhizophagus irregularis]